MKKLFTFLLLLLATTILRAQMPQKMSYQAIIRNGSELLKNKQIGMQISILKTTTAGPVVYSETQTPNTNENGLIAIEIGGGSGFDNINWTDGTYYLKTQIDPSGGTNYTIELTNQLLSVPYAFHSKTAETLKDGIVETDPVFTNSIASDIKASDTANWNNKLDVETDPKITPINTNFLFKWDGSKLVQSIIFDNGKIGINNSNPGQLVHLGDGNLLIEGGGETAFIIKRDFTCTGGPSGTSINPIFSFGRVVKAGDGDPEFRFLYSDDLSFERPVFEFDRKGIIASVKPDFGSHFEGFIMGDVEPLFRLNSYPSMRLEMGAGGNSPVDIAIGRLGTAKLGLFTNSTSRLTVDSNGNVGIGVSAPERTLHVNDVLRLQPRATAPSDPKAGDMYIDSSDSNKLKVYDGTTWQSCW